MTNPNATTVPTPQMSQIEILVSCVNELARQEKELAVQSQLVKKNEKRIEKLEQEKSENKEVGNNIGSSLRDKVRNRLWIHCKNSYEKGLQNGHHIAPLDEDVDNVLFELCRAIIEQDYNIDLRKEFDAAWQHWHNKFNRDYEPPRPKKQPKENLLKQARVNRMTVQELIRQHPEFEWICEIFNKG